MLLKIFIFCTFQIHNINYTVILYSILEVISSDKSIDKITNFDKQIVTRNKSNIVNLHHTTSTSSINNTINAGNQYPPAEGCKFYNLTYSII